MTADYKTSWMPPAQPLGEAIRRAEAKPLDTSLSDFICEKWKTPCGQFITEQDCRQVKGAAQAGPASGAVAPSARPDVPVAAPPSDAVAPLFKVGDRVRIVRDTHYWNGREGVVCGFLGEWVKAHYEDTPYATGEGAGFRRDCLELITPAAPDGDGWVAADGRNVPSIPCGTSVELKRRNGTIFSVVWSEKYSAEFNLWNHDFEHECDRMAYRILKAAP